MSERWTQIKELFREALEIEPARQEAFIHSRCPDDPELRDRVLAMLKEYDTHDSFLQSPIASAARNVFHGINTHDLVGQRIGAYEIKRAIAEGGMGVVFEAMDVKLKKKVALKMMNPALVKNPTFRSRFDREAQLLAQLEDPHIVRVYALIEEKDNAFIVMEYVDGITLAQHIQSKGRLSSREVAGMGIQLLQALSKAHRQGVIHRDLKPSNIMLTRTNEGRAIVKVLDFGIAKSLESDISHTRTQGAIGTLFYMSPEQARGGKSVDHRTDLYSLGVTLYEALSGELPFQMHEDEFGVRRDIVEGRVIPLTSHSSDASPAFAEVIMKAISTNPDERYQSSKAMQKALAGTLGETSRQPIRTPVETKKKMPAWRVVIGLIGLFGITAAGYFFIQQSRTAVVEPPQQSLASASPIAGTTKVFEQAPPESLLVTPVEAQLDEIGEDGAEAGEDQISENGEEEPAAPTSEPQTQISLQEPPPAETESNSVQSSPDEQEQNETIQDPDITEPEADTSSSSEPPAPQEPEQTGVLQLDIVPFGDVYVDDVLQASDLIIEKLELPAGTRTFRIENDADRWMCTLTLSSGQPSNIKVNFDSSVFATIRAVDTNDDFVDNAVIFVDGQQTSYSTPQKIELSPGVHRIEVRRNGYEFVESVPVSSQGCFQQVGPAHINFDESLDGQIVQVRLRAVQ